MPRLLLLFTAVNLIVGTAAFGVSGILAPVAQTLEVSVAAAGQAITAYAVATALLPPLMLAAVLDRFFALYTSINSFTRVVVKRGEEEWKRWEPKTGRQPVL